MHKVTIVALAIAGAAAFPTVASSAKDLAEIVKERRGMMKEIVRPAAKLGGDMVKGKIPFEGSKAAEAMTDISGVPDKYVTLFPAGTEYGATADSEASPNIWEDFAGFKELAQQLKDASAEAASAATEGEDAFETAFTGMTKVCKNCHESYRVKD